jgi:hypothetical protein
MFKVVSPDEADYEGDAGGDEEGDVGATRRR